MSQRHVLGTFAATLVAVAAAAMTPSTAHARKMVFAETWQNGTDSWRTQRANGGDCKGWPTCPFVAGEYNNTFPAALIPNNINLRDHDGAGNRDANVCNGKYVNIPKAIAGWDAANIAVTGGVKQDGQPYLNAQFPVVAGDKLCMVAWVRAYADAGGEEGPYVGINYTGAHGVVDAGHNHGTHYMIGSMATDPADTNGWPLTPRSSYGAMTQIVKDGNWHRYTAAFTVLTNDVSDSRRFSPELSSNITWTPDSIVYGQPRLLLFGKPSERSDTPAFAPVVTKDADFGDVYVFKAENGDANACPSAAELDALAFASDKVTCGADTVCKTKVVGVPATDRQPAYPNNQVYYCSGCTQSFGAPASDTTCGATKPFCLNIGAKGGTCTPCGGDAASALGATTKCAVGNPTCMTAGGALGSCGKCAADADCVNPGADKIHVGPTCNTASGACFACKTDNGVGDAASACGATAPHCDVATGLCGGCKANADCAGAAHGGPFCNVATGSCTTCKDDFGAAAAPTTCPEAAPHCNAGATDKGICGKCASNADCANAGGASTHAGQICNVDKGLCGKCNGDAEVSSDAYGCKGDTPTCRADGVCAKCASNDDCTNPPGITLHAKSVCNLGTGVCEGPPAPTPPGPDGSSGSSGSSGASGTSGTSGASGSSGASSSGASSSGDSSGDNGTGNGGGCSTAPANGSAVGLAAFGLIFAMGALRRKKRN